MQEILHRSATMHYRAFWDWSALLVLNVFTGDVKTAGTFLRPKGHSMFRFTIRDLLWLMVVVALLTERCADRWYRDPMLRFHSAGDIVIRSYPHEPAFARFVRQNLLHQ